MTETTQEMLAALCFIGDGEKGRELFSFLPPTEQEPLERLGRKFLRGEGKLNGREIATRIRRLAQLDQWSGLEEIHPGWILEALADESPRVLGLICRFLSGEKVRYILNHLPPGEKTRLPRLIQSFSVSSEILEIVRTLVEKRLGLTLPPHSASFSFSHIGWMKGEDLRTLFKELGLEEVRRAFWGFDTQVFKAFLSRFSPSQAREVRERVERSAVVSPEQKTEAQLHLVSLSLVNLPPEELFREIGFSVFARAILPVEKDLVRRVGQRLSPEEGHRLLRVMKESETNPGEAKARKESILATVYSLGARKKISRYWKEEKEIEPTMSEASEMSERVRAAGGRAA